MLGMKVLALEFSSPLRSVAVAADGVVLGRAQEQGGRETHAFAMIESVLRQAGLAREQIECVCVGTGPGSYTGIRIAIAIAQGWQLAREVKLCGISSADCVAAQLHARGWRGSLEIVVDAQRNELFAADYRIGEGGWQLTEPFRLRATGSANARPGTLSVRPDVTVAPAGFEVVFPDAARLATLACRGTFVRGSELDAIYLRKAEFVKAPPARTQ